MKNLTERAMLGLPNIRRDLGLETDMQRDMRLMQQGDVMGQTLSQGLPAPIANLSAGILRNIPGITDNVRQLGVQSGMSGLQTESELFEKALSGYDGTAAGQARVVQSLTAINPEMGAMMASKMQTANQQSRIGDLQERKLQKEVTDSKWTPMMGFYADGKQENVWVSPSGQMQDVEGNTLEGDQRPRRFLPVSVAASNIADAGPSDLVSEWRNREAIDKTFVSGAMNAYRMIQRQPAAATFSAQAAQVYNGLKENYAYFNTINNEYTSTFKAGKTGFDKNKVEAKIDKLGIEGAEFKALMINLAYQKAKSMQGSSDRISDTDLNNALEAIGGGIGDSDSILAILRNNIIETADNYDRGYATMFNRDEDYSPFNAMENFGINDFFKEINFDPAANQGPPDAEAVNSIFGAID